MKGVNQVIEAAGDTGENISDSTQKAVEGALKAAGGISGTAVTEVKGALTAAIPGVTVD